MLFNNKTKMIIGITGSICSGKKAFAEYLKNKHDFKIINLVELFKAFLKHKGLLNSKESSPLRSSRRINNEESIENEDNTSTKEE